MTRIAALAASVLLFAAGSTWPQPPAGGAAHLDLRAALAATAERIVLPERCGECHAAEFEVWETTAHAAGFDTLHRRDRAKEIYRLLGLRLIKRGTDEATPACLSCHYTPVLRRGELRAGAGVTCESCHGAARDWVSTHNDYGVAEADFQRAARLETPEHRTQRIADSRAAGMRRPSDLYDVAANCFGCHTVPNEDLVNRGGHSTGSDFEIVAWSDRIRHNFLESYKTADGRTNAERPREWKRKMYVVGRALDLEYAVRGLAAATRRDELYFLAMSDPRGRRRRRVARNRRPRGRGPAARDHRGVGRARRVGRRPRPAARGRRPHAGVDEAVHCRRRRGRAGRAGPVVGRGGGRRRGPGAGGRDCRPAGRVAAGERGRRGGRRGAPGPGSARRRGGPAARGRVAAAGRGRAGRRSRARRGGATAPGAGADGDAHAPAVARPARARLREGPLRALPQRPGAVVAERSAFDGREGRSARTSPGTWRSRGPTGWPPRTWRGGTASACGVTGRRCPRRRGRCAPASGASAATGRGRITSNRTRPSAMPARWRWD